MSFASLQLFFIFIRVRTHHLLKKVSDPQYFGAGTSPAADGGKSASFGRPRGSRQKTSQAMVSADSFFFLFIKLPVFIISRLFLFSSFYPNDSLLSTIPYSFIHSTEHDFFVHNFDCLSLSLSLFLCYIFDAIQP
jgi:hypothetical protein